MPDGVASPSVVTSTTSMPSSAANMMLGRALYAAGEYREAEARARFVRDLLGRIWSAATRLVR
jgi:hypothetical protein